MVCAGDGRDKVHGDYIRGGDGNDSLRGLGGSDKIHGNFGWDGGGAGRDGLKGDGGTDACDAVAILAT